ncbi:hypothetical protein JCM8097_002091 [Rhodosporidiobolus ruineniae]
MFKFFKSKTSPNPSSSSPKAPSASPAPPEPPHSSSAPAAKEALHGLGLGLPTDHELEGAVGGSRNGQEGRKDRSGGVEASGRAGANGTASAVRRNSALPPLPEGGLAGSGTRNVSGGTGGSRSPAPAAGGGGGGASPHDRDRPTSPALSFSPSSGSSAVFHQSPYGASVGTFGERDPSQIHAPTTWSEMAHQELVVNVSSRERTRQEILWEVVASEERYVAELRSLVELYANPLLHPLLASSSPPLAGTSPLLGASSPPLGASSPPLGYSSPPLGYSSNTSSADLPIAARFARSTGSLASSSGNRTPVVGPGGLNAADIPEIEDDPSAPRHASSSSQPRKTGLLGRSSLPALPTGARNPSSASFDTLHPPDPPSNGSSGGGGASGLLTSLGFRTSRHPLRPAPSAQKLHKPSSRAPAEALKPPGLPEAVKRVLESTVEMLKGHEELSARLKERWAKDFPLVRGLAAIWSDQPWFLQTYASYIVSLEEALSILDTLLPSAHSPAMSSYAAKFKSPKTRGDKEDKRLAKLLMTLEERAADAGEGSLSICLSKPLMRLSKLPLLMQALLYHTDPTTHEWEKTRAMALEVDALVRSIEDEKIEEEERERTRDVLARIDGINDKALMAPRSSRIVLEELPAPDRSAAPRGKSGRKSLGSSTSSASRSTASDWLIRFTDVVIRAQKIGETNIPGSFSRDKEKKGKQGKTRKTGQLRNTYRFIRIERWEHNDPADAALTEMDGLRRAITEETERTAGQGETDSEDEFDMDGAESRMSFRYDSDEPQPAAADHRDFSAARRRTSHKPIPRSSASPLAPTTAKFGARLRVGSEDVAGMRVTSPASGRHRFDSPTLSSQMKAHPASPPQPGRRTASTPAPAAAGHSLAPPPPRTVPPPTSGAVAPASGLAHARDESTFGLYSIWAAQDSSPA